FSSNSAWILTFSSSRRAAVAEVGRVAHSCSPEVDTPSQVHIIPSVGARRARRSASLATAYSASMNSYFSLTVAPSRSTLPLFLGRHSPFPVHGSSVPAHATEHVRKYSARAHPRRVLHDGCAPS